MKPQNFAEPAKFDLADVLETELEGLVGNLLEKDRN